MNKLVRFLKEHSQIDEKCTKESEEIKKQWRFIFNDKEIIKMGDWFKENMYNIKVGLKFWDAFEMFYEEDENMKNILKKFGFAKKDCKIIEQNPNVCPCGVHVLYPCPLINIKNGNIILIGNICIGKFLTKEKKLTRRYRKRMKTVIKAVNNNCSVCGMYKIFLGEDYSMKKGLCIRCYCSILVVPKGKYKGQTCYNVLNKRSYMEFLETIPEEKRSKWVKDLLKIYHAVPNEKGRVSN